MARLRLRSGIFLPPHHTLNENPTLALDRDLELLEWLDRLDYEEAWIGEHHSGGYEIISSPELMIAAAAQRTRRIRLGTGVVSLVYHNPMMVAEHIVQLDHLTKGRVMFGAGPGSLVFDAKQIGIDPLMTRDRMEESLEVILRLFKGERVTKETEWFTLKDALLHLMPYSDPHPEVVVASTKTPFGGRIAGKYGLGLICITASSVDGYDALASNWRLANEIAAENGHTMDRSRLRLVAPIHIAETRDQARANVRFGLEQWLDYIFTNAPGGRRATVGLDPFEVVTKVRGGIIGTPDDVIELIDRLYAKQGEFGCFLHMAHNWADWEATKRSYELYARYVVPHFRKSNENRVASFQQLKDAETMVAATQAGAVEKMFAKNEAERGKKGKGPRS